MLNIVRTCENRTEHAEGCIGASLALPESSFEKLQQISSAFAGSFTQCILGISSSVVRVYRITRSSLYCVVWMDAMCFGWQYSPNVPGQWNSHCFARSQTEPQNTSARARWRRRWRKCNIPRLFVIILVPWNFAIITSICHCIVAALAERVCCWKYLVFILRISAQCVSSQSGGDASLRCLQRTANKMDYTE